MEGLGSNSFTPLGTISPALPALLLAGACNPVMDLVALITSPTHLRASIKGKGRADDERKVSLWRMSGTRVWEVGYEGIIAGLAWSPDGTYHDLVNGKIHSSSGLYLTLLTYIESGDGAKWTIAHLSVHDGATIHSSGLNPEQGEESLRAVRDDKAFWDLEWSTSSIPWPVPEVRPEASSISAAKDLERVQSDDHRPFTESDASRTAQTDKVSDSPI